MRVKLWVPKKKTPPKERLAPPPTIKAIGVSSGIAPVLMGQDGQAIITGFVPEPAPPGTVLAVPTVAVLQATPGTTNAYAVVENFALPGDTGGGVFYYTLANAANTITAVTRQTATVASTSVASDVADIEIETAAPHPFVTNQAVSISGVSGEPNANGNFLITVIDDTHFTLRFTNGVGGGSGGTITSMVLTFAADHGRYPAQRLAIQGVVWAGFEGGINGQWNRIGVVSATELAIATAVVGSYVSGGVVGDNALTVPTVDGLGVWNRQVPNSVLSVRWFGATGNGVTDDAPAIQAAIEAGRSSATGIEGASLGGASIYFPGGNYNTYYCAAQLIVDNPITMFGDHGDGLDYPSAVIQFAAGVGAELDPFSNDNYTGNAGIVIYNSTNTLNGVSDGDGSQIQDLAVVQLSGGSPLTLCGGIGIHASFCGLKNVLVSGFSGDGIILTSAGPGDANADNWWMSGIVTSQLNGRYGVFIHGEDASGGAMNANLVTQFNGSWGLWAGGFEGNNYTGAVNTQGNGIWPDSGIWFQANTDFASFTWSSGASVTKGQLILPPIGCNGSTPPNYRKGNGYQYRALTSGVLSSGAFPVATYNTNTTLGDTFTDGTVTVQCWMEEGGPVLSDAGQSVVGSNSFAYVYAEENQQSSQVSSIYGFNVQSEVGFAPVFGGLRSFEINTRIDAGASLGVIPILFSYIGGYGDSQPYNISLFGTNNTYGDGTVSASWKNDPLTHGTTWNYNLVRWQVGCGPPYPGNVGEFVGTARGWPWIDARIFPAVWVGLYSRERRVTALPCTTITSTTFIPDFSGFSTSGTDSQIAGSYQVGDVILNTVNNGETRPAYPVGWRPRQYAGGTAQYAAGGGLGNSAATWQAGFSYAYGQVILEDGYAFQASFTVDIGVSGGTIPNFASVETPGDTIADNSITWTNVGPSTPVFDPVIPEAPILGTISCTAGGAIHPTNPDTVAYQRIKLTGSPGGSFTLQIDGGAAGGWDRVIWNTTGQQATILGSSGDTGVAVPAGDAYHLLSDGTTCVHVT